jgi:hypothetical protein
MPFCPRCGDEYRTGFTHCADCGVALVDAPAPEDDPSRPYEPSSRFDPSDYESVELVRVLTAATQIQAEVVLSALRSADLRAYIAGTGMEAWTQAGNIGQLTGVPGPLNDYRIMVHPDDEDEAREIIASASGQAVDFELDEDEEQTALDASDPGSDGMGPLGDRPAWRMEPRRNSSLVRALALFMIFSMLLTGLAISFNWLYVLLNS